MDMFLSLLELCAVAFSRCRVRQVVLYNSQDAFPMHNDRLRQCLKQIAMIPTETLEMHGVAFGPCSAALDGVCDALKEREVPLTTLVWSPWAANPTQGALVLAQTLIDVNYTGCFYLESRLDPSVWHAIWLLLTCERHSLSALHVCADMHSSTPPDPHGFVHAMLTQDTSLQTLHLQGMAMDWFYAAAFPVEVSCILRRNQLLARVRQLGHQKTGGSCSRQLKEVSSLSPSPGLFGQTLVYLAQQKPAIAASAMHWLLQNHVWSAAMIP